MTREVFNRQPEKVQRMIESLRADYKKPCMSAAETRNRAAGYVQGLRDAGLITERERMVLFLYCTV